MGWEGKRDGCGVIGFDDMRYGIGFLQRWVVQLWLVARRPSTMVQCSAARSLVFDDGAVIRCLLVGFDR